jgi:hypothetical protein
VAAKLGFFSKLNMVLDEQIIGKTVVGQTLTKKLDKVVCVFHL